MKKHYLLKNIIPLTALIALIVTLGFSAIAMHTAYAATIVVTTTDDELNADGDCSLREAIVAANTDTAVDACPAGSGADVIELPAGSYILTLVGEDEDASAGDLDITQDLTLNGAGPLQTTLDGNNIDRVFHIRNNANVQLSRMTITGGNPSSLLGGNIYVYQGSLSVFLCRIWHSTGSAGISLSPLAGSLTVLDSRIQDNTGSGIVISSGAAGLIVNSTISGNATDYSGGGISNAGVVTIINSTISGNTSAYDGGGISISGVAYLYNVTITGNTADDDVNEFGNGGGISVSGSGTLTMRNSIIAGNLDNSSNPAFSFPDCSGTIYSEGYNLIQKVDCTLLGDLTGNITNRSALLGPLHDNGGPTFTHALLINSPAIDAGDPGGCTDQNNEQLGADQRGYVRNGVCDMGAYEYNSVGTATPTITPLSPSATPTHIIISPTATLPALPPVDFLPFVLNQASFGATTTSTATPSPTETDTPSATEKTPTPTETHTPTPTATHTPTFTATSTKTATPTQDVPPVPTPTAIEGYGYINIVDYAYEPATITIHVNALVTWENTGLVDHTATSDSGVWDSGTLAPTEKFQYQFTQAGTYPYHCTFHADMAGTIIVVP